MGRNKGCKNRTVVKGKQCSLEQKGQYRRGKENEGRLVRSEAGDISRPCRQGPGCGPFPVVDTGCLGRQAAWSCPACHYCHCSWDTWPGKTPFLSGPPSPRLEMGTLAETVFRAWSAWAFDTLIMSALVTTELTGSS